MLVCTPIFDKRNVGEDQKCKRASKTQNRNFKLTPSKDILACVVDFF